jgi:AcrR family transcriptional regulator
MPAETLTKSGRAKAGRQKVTDHRTRTGAVRRAQTRRKLMAAALAVYARKSPDAASIDDFVEEANVSRGTFYNHFGTTQELLDLVSAEISDGILEVIDKVVLTFDDAVERVAAGCLSYMTLAIENRAWGHFVVRVGLQGDAGGELVNIYLPRDLDLARQTGKMHFPTMQVAHDIIMGCVVRSIQSVILGKAPPEHIRQTLEIAFLGLGVEPDVAKRVCRMPVPELPLSGHTDFSTLIRNPG